MNSVKSNNLSLKYQRFTSSGCNDISIRIFKFVSKAQFLWLSPTVHLICGTTRRKPSEFNYFQT